METPGGRLKRARERLQMRYREVEEASQKIAARLGNPEYAIALSRLSDIENKGLLPSLYRLYSLAAIYRLELREVIGWYGVQFDAPSPDSTSQPLDATHITGWTSGQAIDSQEDSGRSGFLPRLHRWGGTATALLAGFDGRHHRFGYIGLKDWSMHPLIEPGALLLVDTRRRKIAAEGWSSETDRPVYFLEHREGYLCGWCSAANGSVIVQFHPASTAAPIVYREDEVEVVGQVVGTAMLLESRHWRVAPTASTRAGSRSR